LDARTQEPSLKHPKGYVFTCAGLFTFGFLLWGARSLLRLLQLTDEVRNCRLGLRGEQAVAEALSNQAVVAAGYMTFHDVPGDVAWNIDHVVVGPGGVFVIETKTRSHRKGKIRQQENVVIFDGRMLQFPWCQDREAAKQAARNTAWVRRFMEGFAPRDTLVQPIVVVPGWYVENKGEYSVMVMNTKWLAGFLPRERKRFTREQLQPLLRRFDERCRDVDF